MMQLAHKSNQYYLQCIPHFIQCRLCKQGKVGRSHTISTLMMLKLNSKRHFNVWFLKGNGGNTYLFSLLSPCSSIIHHHPPTCLTCCGPYTHPHSRCVFWAWLCFRNRESQMLLLVLVSHRIHFHLHVNYLYWMCHRAEAFLLFVTVNRQQLCPAVFVSTHRI